MKCKQWKEPQHGQHEEGDKEDDNNKENKEEKDKNDHKFTVVHAKQNVLEKQNKVSMSIFGDDKAKFIGCKTTNQVHKCREHA